MSAYLERAVEYMCHDAHPVIALAQGVAVAAAFVSPIAVALTATYLYLN